MAGGGAAEGPLGSSPLSPPPPPTPGAGLGSGSASPLVRVAGAGWRGGHSWDDMSLQIMELRL